jgi:hypothetical protein
MSVSSLQIDDNAFLTDGDGDPWYSGSLERVYTHAVSNAVRELCGAGVAWIGGKFVATNAATLAGTVPDASIATNTPSASSGMLLAWNKAGQRFWTWLTSLRNSTGTVALDASTAGRLDAKGNTWTNVPGISITAPFWMRPVTNAVTAFQIRNATGTSVFNVDTVNGRCGFGMTAPTTTIEVNGDVYVNKANAHNAFYINRSTVSYGAGITYRHAGNNAWVTGLRGTADSNYHIYSYGVSADVFMLDYTTGNAGFGTNATSRLHVRGTTQPGTVSNATWAANQTFPAGQLAGNAPYASVTNAAAAGTALYTNVIIGANYKTNTIITRILGKVRVIDSWTVTPP